MALPSLTIRNYGLPNSDKNVRWPAQDAGAPENVLEGLAEILRNQPFTMRKKSLLKRQLKLLKKYLERQLPRIVEEKLKTRSPTLSLAEFGKRHRRR